MELSIGMQVLWLFVLGLPIASITWTVTHEEIFREPREWAQAKSEKASSYFVRKFFYIPTCEYCFSHYVTIVCLAVTEYKLLFNDWRGYLIAFFALPYVANVYTGLYAQTKLEAKKDRVEAKILETEAAIKKVQSEEVVNNGRIAA